MQSITHWYIYLTSELHLKWHSFGQCPGYERPWCVTIDSKLNFHSHSTYIVSKANRLLGLIRKSFENISIQTLPMLYKSLVRPTLEYGNPIWGPYYVLDQQAVERVQRRATRMIQPLRDLPYHTRLHQLNLPSLTYRRRRGDMIIIYQITHHLLNIPFPTFSTPSSYISTRGHNYKLLKSHFRCRPRQSFFSALPEMAAIFYMLY